LYQTQTISKLFEYPAVTPTIILSMIDLVVPHRAFAPSSFFVTTTSFSFTVTLILEEKSKDNSHKGPFTTMFSPFTVADAFSSIATGIFHILDIYFYKKL